LNFSFHIPTRICFGSGSISGVGREIARLEGSKTVLIVTDKGVASTGIINQLMGLLQQDGYEPRVYDQVRPNPESSIIDQGADFARDAKANAVVGVGGGSSLDTAKGIAVLLANGGKISDYFGLEKPKIPPAPVLAIPTTAGTGSEVSTAISVTEPKTHAKKAVRSWMVPARTAILDPDLLATLPSQVVVDTGMDALCHLIESYVSRGANPFTDTLSLRGIELIGKYLPRLVANRFDFEAASSMLLAAMYGGIVISIARTGAAHTVTRPMAGLTHGLACAIALPHVMEFNLIANPTKFSNVARAMGYPSSGNTLEDADTAVAAVRSLAARIGVPSRFRDVGLDRTQIPRIAEMAMELEISGLNPRELSVGAITRILEAAW